MQSAVPVWMWIVMWMWEHQSVRRSLLASAGLIHLRFSVGVASGRRDTQATGWSRGERAKRRLSFSFGDRWPVGRRKYSWAGGRTKCKRTHPRMTCRSFLHFLLTNHGQTRWQEKTRSRNSSRSDGASQIKVGGYCCLQFGVVSVRKRAGMAARPRSACCTSARVGASPGAHVPWSPWPGPAMAAPSAMPDCSASGMGTRATGPRSTCFASSTSSAELPSLPLKQSVSTYPSSSAVPPSRGWKMDSPQNWCGSGSQTCEPAGSSASTLSTPACGETPSALTPGAQ
eukprot:scaffold11352_cov114-Isochrysis_galbana.AAC.3